jgi:L-threonylcarbamoyladenylate synthase
MPKSPVARIYRGTPRNLALLARCLRAGELVAVPTETVYGLAANALDSRACRKIFAAKGRPTTDPLIVHAHTIAQVEAITEMNGTARRLAEQFWPGPLTLVLPKRPAVPAIVSAGLPSLAVRLPSHPLFRQLLKLAGIPLAAPSANPFGYVSPTTAQHVQDGLGKNIRHILDGGAARIGLESTIVDVRNPAQPRLLRPGAITLAALEHALGQKVRVARRGATRGNKSTARLAPGLHARHYSPRTPIVLHNKLSAPGADSRHEAWVLTAKPAGRIAPNVFWLDARGELHGTARRLFAVLRRLDDGRFKRIHVALAPGGGLADAINDRLRRAAGR